MACIGQIGITLPHCFALSIALVHYKRANITGLQRTCLGDRPCSLARCTCSAAKALSSRSWRKLLISQRGRSRASSMAWGRTPMGCRSFRIKPTAKKRSSVSIITSKWAMCFQLGSSLHRCGVPACFASQSLVQNPSLSSMKFQQYVLESNWAMRTSQTKACKLPR